MRNWACFYLGKALDPADSFASDSPLLYDAKDLTTHALLVGMTGSGKTGLAISLLEEAALDGIPAILIAPKGDLANILLQFPDLRPGDFRPWVDKAEAARMFFVTLLLNEVLAWMRAQPGTGSLRALLYMDEIFGYFPPTANPPSELPMLTLVAPLVAPSAPLWATYRMPALTVVAPV